MKQSEVLESRHSIERLEKMRPLFDRMPESWGKYLPEPGWDELLTVANKVLSEIDPEYQIFQAKEKFGTLRLYIGTENQEAKAMMNLAVRAFEKMSEQICEYCGAKHGYDKQKVYARPFAWVKTLCDTCCVDNGGKV